MYLELGEAVDRNDERAHRMILGNEKYDEIEHAMREKLDSHIGFTYFSGALTFVIGCLVAFGWIFLIHKPVAGVVLGTTCLFLSLIPLAISCAVNKRIDYIVLDIIMLLISCVFLVVSLFNLNF